MGRSSQHVLIWDIRRGVISQMIGMDEKEALTTVCGGQDGKVYAMTHRPHNEKYKVRICMYDCESGKLERKMKVGSSTSMGGGLAVYGEIVAVGGDSLGVKLCDWKGEKLDKVEMIGKGASLREGSSSIFKFSKDGMYLLVSNGGENNVILFRVGKEKKVKMHPMACLKLEDGTISSLDIHVSSKSIHVQVFQSEVGASYFVLPSDQKSSKLDGMVPTLPKATMKTKVESELISSTFHPIRSNELLFAFRNASNGPGSHNTILPIQILSTQDELSGSITLSPPSTDSQGKNKKRRAEALAPGETGMESSITTDLTMTKKQKGNTMEAVDEDGNDVTAATTGEEQEEDFELEDDAEDGELPQSIAERLAMLSSTMEQTTDEEDDDEDDHDETMEESQLAIPKWNKKKATPESLCTLLTQALSSNNSRHLNIALQNNDARLIDNSVKQLQLLDAQRSDPNNSEGYIPMLLGHIVRKMARKHTQVASLMIWIKAILKSSSQIGMKRRIMDDVTEEEEERMAREAKDLASKLGPLRNFLNERVECFPMLLRLEGRLALLGEQL